MQITMLIDAAVQTLNGGTLYVVEPKEVPGGDTFQRQYSVINQQA